MVDVEVTEVERGVAAELGVLLVVGFTAVVTEGGASILGEFNVCWWLLVVGTTVADKDDDVEDGCDSFKCLPRTMSDTVGRLPPQSSMPEVM